MVWILLDDEKHGTGNRSKVDDGKGSQEDTCYRTSFSLTLPAEDMDFKDGVAHSANVVVVRESLGKGHAWCDLGNPDMYCLATSQEVIAVFNVVDLIVHSSFYTCDDPTKR